jgi:hypothetical protein
MIVCRGGGLSPPNIHDNRKSGQPQGIAPTRNGRNNDGIVGAVVYPRPISTIMLNKGNHKGLPLRKIAGIMMVL